MELVYIENGDLAIYNRYRFRRDKSTGYYLSSRKIGEKRKRLHVYIWENEVGEIPEGLSIHHIDGNKSHNEISNFCLMKNSEHCSLHSRQYFENHPDKVLQNINEKVRPKAIEWHKSDAGRKWHKIHYLSTSEKMHRPRDYICGYCGKPYTSTTGFSKYCSNKCKSAARRASGVDDVLKTCKICGEGYYANRYQKTERCPLCRSKGCRSGRAG